MKVVIAPDSFKDSLSAAHVAQAIARGVNRSIPEAVVTLCPMADGGEGTVEAIMAAMKEGEQQTIEVRGPLGVPVTARWGWIPESCTAVIEMAEASGLQLLTLDQREAGRSCTFGTGQLILAALDLKAERIILAIGGSATNDGGAGMLRALGARFFSCDEDELAPGGTALIRLARIDLSGLDPRLGSVQFTVAADVDNPLCGPSGASRVFGHQKGACDDEVLLLDEALSHFADRTAEVLSHDWRDFPGAGAAGGMGFAAKAFLKADFQPGVEVVAELVGLAQKVQGADLVITGEGRCDGQTLRGKTPLGVARIARTKGVPVIVIAGTLGEGYQDLYEQGVTAAFSAISGPMSLAQACEGAAILIENSASDIARLWLHSS